MQLDRINGVSAAWQLAETLSQLPAILYHVLQRHLVEFSEKGAKARFEECTEPANADQRARICFSIEALDCPSSGILRQKAA